MPRHQNYPVWNLDDHSETWRFLKRFHSGTSGLVTHASMCGGRFYVPHEDMQKLRAKMATDARQFALGNLNFAPPLSEQHTRHFCFYLDLDFNALESVLSDGFLRELASLLTEEMARFFPGGVENDTVVICTKDDGRGTPQVVPCMRSWETCAHAREEADAHDRDALLCATQDAYAAYKGRVSTVHVCERAWGDETGTVAAVGDAWYARSASPYESSVCFTRVDARGDGTEVGARAQALLEARVDELAAMPSFDIPEAHAASLATLGVTSDVGVRVDDNVYIRPCRRLFKHGVHVHWPGVVVDITRAYQIRRGVVLALARGAQRLAQHVGTLFSECQLEDVVDGAVYSTGLRMIGAPKAQLVRSANLARPYQWTMYNNNTHQLMRYAIDPRCYMAAMVVRGGEVDADALREGGSIGRSAKDIWQTMAEWTSVRCADDTPVTDGYVAHSGLHVITGPAPRAPPGKRKKTEAASASTPRNYDEPVTDAEKLRVIKDMLVQIGHDKKTGQSHYRDTEITVHYSAKQHQYHVNLRNLGCTYCLNKKDYHRSNRAYMQILLKDKAAYAVMRCYSSRARQGSMEMSCKDFKTIEYKFDEAPSNVLKRGTRTPMAMFGPCAPPTATAPAAAKPRRLPGVIVPSVAAGVAALR